MPRVTQEHLDARRRQILDAARGCFIANGFHATSMQDILSASGLSAGAVYRYFPSKEAIVGAIAQSSLEEVAGLVDAMIAADRPPSLDQAVEALMQVIDDMEREHGFGRLVIQVWSETLRNPALREQMAGTIRGARERFLALIELHQKTGVQPADVPAADIAATLASFVPGYVLQQALLGDVTPHMFASGVRALLMARPL